MSLKLDIEEYPEAWSKELVAVVNDLKKGKLFAKWKLRKFVNREISEYYYHELIYRYRKDSYVNSDTLPFLAKLLIAVVVILVIYLVG